MGVGIAALKNAKARTWIEGRRHWQVSLKEQRNPMGHYIWFHCASVGELEQARPIIDAIKQRYPSHLIAVSIFSPSVYPSAKKNKLLDLVTYLPLDTKKNASQFVSILKPELVIFIKYEYWYHHLAAVRNAGVPLLLVSAIFRRNQIFFKFYGGFYRKMLLLYTAIFLQDEDSLDLIHLDQDFLAGKDEEDVKTKISKRFIVAGDTRFDRVKEIADAGSRLPLIEGFRGDVVTVIAGSTWPQDEALLANYHFRSGIKIIIAPHEVTPEHIQQIRARFENVVLYSELEENSDTGSSILIINNIGMLSKLYRYADICYIGGGFNKSGIHNTLEAAVYGKPLIFGPHFEKFKEARDLIRLKAAHSVSDQKELEDILTPMVADHRIRNSMGDIAANYVSTNVGATSKILNFIQANRLLTN